MTDHPILGCTEPERTNTVEIAAGPGRPEATKPFSGASARVGWHEQASEGRLQCPAQLPAVAEE